MSDALMKIMRRNEPAEKATIYASQIVEIENGIRAIMVWAEGNQNLMLHRFDSRKEIWLESDFVGMTLAEAAALIASAKVN